MTNEKINYRPRIKPQTISVGPKPVSGLKEPEYRQLPERNDEKPNIFTLKRIGAAALVIFAITGFAAIDRYANRPPEFSDTTHEFVVPQDGTVWEAAETVEGADNASAITADYIKSMPENTGAGGALSDGKLNTGEHLVVPDSLDVNR